MEAEYVLKQEYRVRSRLLSLSVVRLTNVEKVKNGSFWRLFIQLRFALFFRRYCSTRVEFVDYGGVKKGRVASKKWQIDKVAKNQKSQNAKCKMHSKCTQNAHSKCTQNALKKHSKCRTIDVIFFCPFFHFSFFIFHFSFFIFPLFGFWFLVFGRFWGRRQLATFRRCRTESGAVKKPRARCYYDTAMPCLLQATRTRERRT